MYGETWSLEVAELEELHIGIIVVIVVVVIAAGAVATVLCSFNKKGVKVPEVIVNVRGAITLVMMH